MAEFTVKATLESVTPSFVRGYQQRLAASPIGARLVRGAFWSLIGTVLARALGLASSVIVARVLGKQGYGQLGIIQSTVEMFGIVGGFSMGITATKHVAELRRTDPERAGRVIGFCSVVSWVTGGLMAVALFAFAPWVAIKTLHAPEVTGLLRIGSLLLLLGAINGAQAGVLAGFEAFKVRARITLIAGVLNFPLMVAGVYFAGIVGAAWALAASAAVNCLLNFVALRKEARADGIRLTYKNWHAERSLLWRFSLPAVLSGAVYAPIAWTANILLVKHSHGFAEMGVYSAARQWQNLLLLLPNIFAAVALPVFSSSLNAGKTGQDYQSAFRISHSVAILAAFPICATLMFSGEWLLRLYGRSFAEEGVPVIIGVLLGALIQCSSITAGTAVQAKGKIWMGFFYNVSWGILFLGGVVLFVEKFGAAALSFSGAFANLVTAIWVFWYMRRDLPPAILGRMYASLVFAVIISAAALLTPATLRVFLVVPALLLTTLVAAFGLSDPAWRKALRNRKNKTQAVV